MKKQILAVLFSVLTVSLFAGGNLDQPEAEKTEKPAGDYPVTISVFTIQQMQEPPADNKIFKWIKQKFNVDFKWDILVGDKDQKEGLMIASGDYPDLVEIGDRKFTDAEALIPLEKLIDEYAPHIKAHYAQCWQKMYEDDGHIYCLPSWGVITGKDQSSLYNDSALWIQKKVLQEFNYPKITTMDEYFDVLKRYKAKHPEINGMSTIPFTILTYDWHAFCLINPPNFLAGYPNDGNGTVDKINGKWTYRVFLYQDISKRWFKKLNQENAEGMIDRSCFVDNYDQYLSKLSSGRVLGIHDQLWQFQNAMTALENSGHYERTMAPLPIVLDSSIRPHYRNLPIPNLNRGWAITVNCKDPVRVLRFMDEQLEEENQRILHWGIEGEDWQYDENNHPYRTQKQRDEQKDQGWILHNKATLWYQTAPKIEGSFSDGYAAQMNDIPSEYQAGKHAEDIELWKAYDVDNYAELMDKEPPENALWFPMWQIDPPDGSDAQFAWNKCGDVYRKYLPKIILGSPSEFDENWADYVQALKDAGISKYEAFMQQKLDERLEKWSKQN